MATYTSFLNLEKPTTSERLDVLKINSNWDKIDEGVSSLNSKIASNWGTKTEWLETVEQDGSGATAVFSKSGNMVTISVVTASRAHAENDLIATIETGYRPNVMVNTVGAIGTTPCIVRFGTDGRVLIWLLSSTVTGRLYVTVTFATP